MTPETLASVEKWIALLGRRDTPVDGVEDYSSFLSSALAKQGVTLSLVHVEWDRLGWLGALRQLSREARDWRGQWVLLQYTALGWSRRGFPFGALLAMRLVRRRGARLAVVYHEPMRQPGGTGWMDRLRGAIQEWVIRALFARAERAIFADPLEAIPWLPENQTKAAFIPIGGNIPESRHNASGPADPVADHDAITVAVYCLSTLPNRERELSDIARAVAAASSQGAKLRLIFLGRGTEDANDEICGALGEGGASVRVLGLQNAQEVSRALAAADLMLSVRGPLFPRRGSVIAGIACGLPIIGYSNGKSAFPLSEAGVELVPWRDPQSLANAFVRVVQDAGLRESLRSRSHRAFEQYFCWDAIARSFRSALHAGATRE